MTYFSYTAHGVLWCTHSGLVIPGLTLVEISNQNNMSDNGRTGEIQYHSTPPSPTPSKGAVEEITKPDNVQVPINSFSNHNFPEFSTTEYSKISLFLLTFTAKGASMSKDYQLLNHIKVPPQTEQGRNSSRQSPLIPCSFCHQTKKWISFGQQSKITDLHYLIS